MFLAGHMGIAVFMARFMRLSLPIVAVGALIPDLVDKPLPYLFGVGYTRFVGHTLLLCGLLYLVPVLSGRREIGAALAFGSLTHLALDFSDVLWFYPLMDYELYLDTNSFLHYFSSPKGFLGDILGLSLLQTTRYYYYSFPQIILGWPPALYSFKKES